MHNYFKLSASLWLVTQKKVRRISDVINEIPHFLQLIMVVYSKGFLLICWTMTSEGVRIALKWNQGPITCKIKECFCMLFSTFFLTLTLTLLIHSCLKVHFNFPAEFVLYSLRMRATCGEAYQPANERSLFEPRCIFIYIFRDEAFLHYESWASQYDNIYTYVYIPG